MECEYECGMVLNGDDITLDVGAEMDFHNLDVMTPLARLYVTPYSFIEQIVSLAWRQIKRRWNVSPDCTNATAFEIKHRSVSEAEVY